MFKIKYLFILSFLILFQINILAQTITEINSKIDSLKILRSKLENDIAKINTDISNYENKKNELGIIESNYKIKAQTINNANLYEKSIDISNILTVVPMFDSVEISGYDGNFWKAEYKNKIGYVRKSDIVNNAKLSIIINKLNEENIQKQKEIEKKGIFK